MTNKQTRKLHKKLTKLSKVDNINSGGCAISALAIKEILKRDFDIKSTIVYMHNDYMAANPHKLQTCAHAVVKVGKIYYDANGSYDKEFLEERGFSGFNKVSNKYVEKSLLLTDWNNAFDRTKGIPQIEKALKVDLTKHFKL